MDLSNASLIGTDAPWRASTHSGCQELNQCVEVAPAGGIRLVRDSKAPTGPALAFGGPAFAAFIRAAKNGEHDLT